MEELETHKFTGKALFIAAGIFCFFTIIFIPLGIFFFIAAFKAHITFGHDELVYRMFGTRHIPYKEIRAIRVLNPVDVRYKIGYTIPTFATVVPLQIERKNGKKVKFSLNYFEKPDEIALKLQQKTGLKLEFPK